MSNKCRHGVDYSLPCPDCALVGDRLNRLATNQLDKLVDQLIAERAVGKMREVPTPEKAMLTPRGLSKRQILRRRNQR